MKINSRHVCTNSNAYYMVIVDIVMLLNNLDSFEHFVTFWPLMQTCRPSELMASPQRSRQNIVFTETIPGMFVLFSCISQCASKYTRYWFLLFRKHDSLHASCSSLNGNSDCGVYQNNHCALNNPSFLD